MCLSLHFSTKMPAGSRGYKNTGKLIAPQAVLPRGWACQSSHEQPVLGHEEQERERQILPATTVSSAQRSTARFGKIRCMLSFVKAHAGSTLL